MLDLTVRGSFFVECQRIDEVMNECQGLLGTLVSTYYLICRHHNHNIVLDDPALLWFRNQSHTPIEIASPGVVVENGLVQQDEDNDWKE